MAIRSYLEASKGFIILFTLPLGPTYFTPERWKNVWAATWQNQQNECAQSEDSDQPGHPPSLNRVFAVHMKELWVLSYPLSAQQRLWSDWADAHADLSLCWVHRSCCWFCHMAAPMLVAVGWSGFNVAFNNFSVISWLCLVVTESSMLTFIVLPQRSIMSQTLDMIPHPVTLPWH